MRLYELASREIERLRKVSRKRLKWVVELQGDLEVKNRQVDELRELLKRMTDRAKMADSSAAKARAENERLVGLLTEKNRDLATLRDELDQKPVRSSEACGAADSLEPFAYPAPLCGWPRWAPENADALRTLIEDVRGRQ